MRQCFSERFGRTITRVDGILEAGDNSVMFLGFLPVATPTLDDKRDNTNSDDNGRCEDDKGCSCVALLRSGAYLRLVVLSV